MIPWENLKLWYGYPLKGFSWPDVSKHLNDGTIIGGGWEEDGIEFDGIDDYANAGHHSSLDITEEITVEVLIKPYSYGGGNMGRMVNKYGIILLYEYAIKKAKFRLRTSADVNKDVLAPEDSIPFNEWTHVVGTYDGSIQKIYTNGVVSANTNSWSGTIKSEPTENFYVGNREEGARCFDGKIAMVHIYDKALTAEQVREAFEQSYRLI